MDSTQKKQQPRKGFKNDSLVENFSDIGRGVAQTIKNDVFGGMGDDILANLFGAPRPSNRSGELKPGQPLDLTTPQTQNPGEPPLRSLAEKFPFPRMRRPEMQRSSVSQETIALLRRQEEEVQKRLNEVRIEIKALITEIKQVDKEIQNTVASEFVDPGIYHISFLDRLKESLKSMLKEMRQSNTWLQVGKSRNKRKGYWSQAKKKQSSFTLHHDRNVATQSG